jgi:ferric-dicitrate binding protein FerR (iron transport regulator)
MSNEIQTDAPTAAYRAAFEAGDLVALGACIAPDATLKSPITDSFEFHGREQIVAVIGDVIAVVEQRRFVADVGDARHRLLKGVGRVRGVALDDAILVTLDDAGLIARMELFVRPLPALTTLAAVLGPRVARRRSRARGVAVAAMIAPLAFMMRSGEKLGARLARP